MMKEQNSVLLGYFLCRQHTHKKASYFICKIWVYLCLMNFLEGEQDTSIPVHAAVQPVCGMLLFW